VVSERDRAHEQLGNNQFLPCPRAEIMRTREGLVWLHRIDDDLSPLSKREVTALLAAGADWVSDDVTGSAGGICLCSTDQGARLLDAG
jgi:hypothetical protein